MIWRDRYINVRIITKPFEDGRAIQHYYVGMTRTNASAKSRGYKQNSIRCAIRVNISESMDGRSDATIVLTGLNASTIWFLSTQYKRFLNIASSAYIEVDAGYTNRHGIIYRGAIMDAQPDLDAPDTTLTLRCIAYLGGADNVRISRNWSGERDLRDIIKDIAKEANILVVDNTSREKKYNVKDCECHGTTLLEFLQRQQCFKLMNIKIDSAIPDDVASGGSPAIITLYDTDLKPSGNPIEIGKEWIIGTPANIDVGVRASIRFRPDIKGLDDVRFISAKAPKARNIPTRVVSITTNIDTKGRWVKDIYATYPGYGIAGKDVFNEQASTE